MLFRSTFDEWRERTGHTILERYGMSETIMLTSNPYRAQDGARVGGTVGYALPGVGVRVHSDQGRPVPTGDIGGIQVRGPNVFKGYWRMPEKTAEEFTADGWFKTGDVAVVEDGYYRIMGRSSVDIIKSGGYKISALEIEEELRKHPAISDCAVVGIPNDEWGELIVKIGRAHV